MFKKISILTGLLAVILVFAGCDNATKIGNPYVPPTFDLCGVTYHMEEDNIPAKLLENGWIFEVSGKDVVVYHEETVQMNKTQTKIVRNEFTMTLAKDSSHYETQQEYDVEQIIFTKDKLTCPFNVQGAKFDGHYNDLKMKFGDTGKPVVADDNSPIYITYSGKTRQMIVNFTNWRADEFVFKM